MNYLCKCVQALAKALIFLPFLAWRRFVYNIEGTQQEQDRLSAIDADLRHKEGKELKPPE